LDVGADGWQRRGRCCTGNFFAADLNIGRRFRRNIDVDNRSLGFSMPFVCRQRGIHLRLQPRMRRVMAIDGHRGDLSGGGVWVEVGERRRAVITFLGQQRGLPATVAHL